MKKYTYLTDHPRNRDAIKQKLNTAMEHMDVRQLLKLYAFAHRMMRDKVK